jgi:hypothetical protein
MLPEKPEPVLEKLIAQRRSARTGKTASSQASVEA